MKSRILTTWIPLAFAMALVPARSLAQTAAVSAPLLNAVSSAQCQCPVARPSSRRVSAIPPRELGVKLVALLPSVGPSFSYARNLSDSIALEGVFDLAFIDDVHPPAGLALAQVRFSEDAGLASERFLSAGIARVTNLGDRDWLGLEGVGLAVGGGSQRLWTDRAGTRVEFQFIRFGQATMIRMTLGAFVGLGD